MATLESLWLRFAQLCETLAVTRSKLVKRRAIAEYLCSLDVVEAGLAVQYLSGAVFPETDTRKLQVGSQLIVRALDAVTGVQPEIFHVSYRRHGDLGSTAEELLHGTKPSLKNLTLQEISTRFDSLATARAQTARLAQLIDVLRSISAMEAKYFIKLMLGDMRTGVKQSVVEEAIADAAQEELAAVRHAGMLLGNLAIVVELAWQHRLSTAHFQMFHPLGFMLASPAASAQEAYTRFATSEVQMEDKYDGMRAQIHCGDPAQPGRVRIFSRTREDVTGSFPELAEWFSFVDAPAILDGEILAWDFAADRALPFSVLQPRLGRKRVTASMRDATPVLYMAFDMLLAEKDLLLDAPLSVRRTRLEKWAETAMLVPRIPRPQNDVNTSQASLFVTEIVTNVDIALHRLKLSPARAALSPEQIDKAVEAARLRGNEGLMLKLLDSAYQPGRRGSAWIKLKRELATLDVVVTAAEYGHGRRAGVLSDYTFAVQDGASLRNVGKAYSGLTDEEIATLTQWFLEHTLDSQNGQLHVEPQIVLEVAFNNIMKSERHDSGYSLRFPRILRIRPDKPIEEIDTLDRVAEIFESQTEKKNILKNER